MLRNVFSRFPSDTCFIATSAAANATSAAVNAKSAVVKKPQLPRGMSLNPYILFVKDQFDQKTDLVTNKGNTAAIKDISNAWKNLPNNQKEVYQKKSQDYRTAKVDEFTKLSQEEREKLIDTSRKEVADRAKRRERKTRREGWEKTNHPSLPPNAYSLFSKSKFAKLKQDGVALTPVANHIVEIAKQWKTLAESEKNKFETEAKKLREKYQIELNEWKKNQTPTKDKPSGKKVDTKQL